MRERKREEKRPIAYFWRVLERPNTVRTAAAAVTPLLYSVWLEREGIDPTPPKQKKGRSKASRPDRLKEEEEDKQVPTWAGRLWTHHPHIDRYTHSPVADARKRERESFLDFTLRLPCLFRPPTRPKSKPAHEAQKQEEMTEPNTHTPPHTLCVQLFLCALLRFICDRPPPPPSCLQHAAIYPPSFSLPIA